MQRIFIILFLIGSGCFAQSGFEFKKSKQKVTIPFQYINNLIFIPINVNGVPLTFLLDTGIEETILFSVDQYENLGFNQADKIYLRGLGSDESTEGYKTINNTLILGKFLEDNNHNILVITNEEFNFSSTVGIPVNGIIGFQFFKNNIVEIDYIKQKLIVRKHKDVIDNKAYRNYISQPITIERNKPYLISPIKIKDSYQEFKFLIDIGNSDAVWLFSRDSTSNLVPERHIDDFLGWGFSGSVFGKRARINALTLGTYEIKNVISSFPEFNSTRNVLMVKDRKGSIGAEIFRRFYIVLDYKNERMFFKKNSNFKEPFYYNVSGIEIAHAGVQWIKTEKSIPTNFVNVSQQSHYQDNILPASLKYEFSLKPIFVISNIRNGSVAFAAGIKRGDIILEINGKTASELSLQKINDIIKKHKSDYLKLKIQRGTSVIPFLLKIEEQL